MNTGLHKKDGFFELMKTQQLHEVPPFIESNIMQKIQPSVTTKSSPIKMESVLVFGLLTSLYVLTTLVSAFIFPHYTLLTDFKTVLLLCILVHVMYELNEILPEIVNFRHVTGTKVPV
jgi:hypothetical protein